MTTTRAELKVFPPPGGLWRRLAASKSVAAVIDAALNDTEDTAVAAIIPVITAAIRDMRAAPPPASP